MKTVLVSTTPDHPVAVRVKVTADNNRQNAAVYKLSRPVEYTDKHDRTHKTNWVWVSFNRFETMAFACDAIGTVLDWGGLATEHGNQSTHADVLAQLGFSVIVETN